MRVYLAGPFFTGGEREFMEKTRQKLREKGYKVETPLDIGYVKGGDEDVFAADLSAIDRCDAMFAILDGLDAGTMCEIGYARARDKKVIGIWTDKERWLDPFVRWLCDDVWDITE